MTTMSAAGRARLSRSLVDWMPIITLVALILLMSLQSSKVLSISTGLAMLESSVIVLVLGLGETFIILLGSIDLTIAAVAAVATILSAMLVPVIGPWAFVVATLFGTLTGYITGSIHTRARIPSFIATLGISGVLVGVGYIISNATPITVTSANVHYLEWVRGDAFGIPNIVIIAGFLLLITYVLEAYTPFGRYVKAIGAGERATSVSGVDVDHYKRLAFTLCGTLAAIAGVLLACRMAGGSVRLAEGLQMKAIAVVVLGGTAISGGVGGVLRTLIGALIVTALGYGMNMAGISPWWQPAIYGAIMIVAVALTIDRGRVTIVK